jgi:hypothetical protein
MNTNEVIAIAETVAEKKTPVKKTIPKKIMGYLKFALFAIQFEDEDILKKLFLDKSIDDIVNIVNDVVENGDQDKTIIEMRKNFLTPPKVPKAKAPAKPRAKKASAADAIVADLVNLATKNDTKNDADAVADVEPPVVAEKPKRKPRAKKTTETNVEAVVEAEAVVEDKPQRKPRAKKAVAKVEEAKEAEEAKEEAEEVVETESKVAADTFDVAVKEALDKNPMRTIDEENDLHKKNEIVLNTVDAEVAEANVFNYTASIGFENESAYKFINKALKIKLDSNYGEHIADNYKISMDGDMAFVSFRKLDAKFIKATMKKITTALKIDENSYSINDSVNDCEITL